MNTVLDEELRERFADPSAGEELLRHALGELQAYREEFERTGDPVARSNIGRWMQRASEYARLCGEMERALELKDGAVEIWKATDRPRAQFLVELQRALVLAELEHADAESEMDRLRDQMKGEDTLEPFYLGFWLEYDARRRMWSGDLDGARDALVRALAFRTEHRAQRIVARTKQAIDVVDNARRRV